MHQRLVAAVARAVEDLDGGLKVNVTGLCRDVGITPKTFYKWAARYREEGLAGLEERSRRPHRSPGRISPLYEDAIVEYRKRLAGAGLDCGAGTIHWHLCRDGTVRPPSEATIWRVLVRRGFVTPEPDKRPRASWRRFEASTPNEWWQIDACDWQLAEGTRVQILNLIDDHSRLCVTSMAVASATTELAWEAFSAAAARYGLPAGCLSDNGLVFSGRLRGFEVHFEVQLRAAGVRPITSRPFHPQTCGKVERFQQTLKKWLTAHLRYATSLVALQRQLEEFREYYNLHRPHRGIGRRTPWERWSAAPAAVASSTALPAPDQRRRLNVTPEGRVEYHPWQIAVGREHTGQVAEVLLSGTRVSVFIAGRLVRDFELDTTRHYQPRPGAKARR
jgi:transposase InsO family protein